jgi:UDP-N-acetyl-alpha-D-muramoyl-L-alanyl-L-glutamate epimerase
MPTLWLGQHQRSRHQLSLSFGVDDLAYYTTIWYECDLHELERRFGTEAMDFIYFHITAFEANKLTSLRPTRIDLGPYGRFHTRAFEDLWHQVRHRVWAQWRYENGLPGDGGPAFPDTAVERPQSPLTVPAGDVQLLVFCGGGKDSLACMHLLEEAGLPYATLQYASSIYGRLGRQHDLISNLLDHCRPAARHRLWLFDDFLDSPVLSLHPELGINCLTAAETPSSLFGAIPVALASGYRYLVLAHERSADTGNLIWEATGEEVNHQWGKSFGCELLLASYIKEHIADVGYFSLLKPIHDVLIFRILRDVGPAIRHTHSCNLEKPWCLRCPKCLYVWVNFMAHLPEGQLGRMFDGTNVLDVPENQLIFRQMLGLESHTPFECIGEVNESRLAFELCRRKGMIGAAMKTYCEECARPGIEVLERYLTVDRDNCNLPSLVSEKVLSLLNSSSASALTALTSLLSGAHGLFSSDPVLPRNDFTFENAHDRVQRLGRSLPRRPES